jgi:hypothetical protein
LNLVKTMVYCILYQLPILFKVQERFIVCIEIAQQVFNLDLQLHKFNDKK